ncbi:MAG: hypothetical protein NZM00_04590, partial [Anaerolinea sp.]|nr:hypothetical protein [Anaerolinea sp.]
MRTVLTGLAQRIGWLYALALIALFVRYIWHNALLAPSLDQWLATYPLVVAAFDGQIDLADVVQTYMGHRHTIPNLISLLGASLTRWDVRFDLFVNILLIVGCVVLVLALFHRSRLPALLGFTAVAVIAILTTPVQFFNQVFGFQICIMLMMLALYGCAYALAQRGPARSTWLVASAATLVATWSFVAGNLLWVLVPIGMWLAGERRWGRFALWAGFAALNVGLFLWGYPPLAAMQSIDFTRPPLSAFLLTFLGGIFSSDLNPLQTLALQNPDQAQIAGLIGLALLT